MRSTQVFDEILYKNSYFIFKKYSIKNAENEFRQNKFLIIFLDYTGEFSKTDSYCVTLVSDRKSWGTISCIKRFESIQIFNATDL